MIKVVTKLRATGERGEPADHQNWKAAKALLVGICLVVKSPSYEIFLNVPGDHPPAGHHLHHHHLGAERLLHDLPCPLCPPTSSPALHPGDLDLCLGDLPLSHLLPPSLHQGFTVTLPYCFLNTEVRSILRHHWLR